MAFGDPKGAPPGMSPMERGGVSPLRPLPGGAYGLGVAVLWKNVFLH